MFLFIVVTAVILHIQLLQPTAPSPPLTHISSIVVHSKKLSDMSTDTGHRAGVPFEMMMITLLLSSVSLSVFLTVGIIGVAQAVHRLGGKCLVHGIPRYFTLEVLLVPSLRIHR